MKKAEKTNFIGGYLQMSMNYFIYILLFSWEWATLYKYLNHFHCDATSLYLC